MSRIAILRCQVAALWVALGLALAARVLWLPVAVGLALWALVHFAK